MLSIDAPRLRVRPIGRLANRMFEYLIALELGRRVSGVEISGYELPEWGLVSEPGQPLPPGTPLLENHLLPLTEAARHLRDGLVAEVESGRAVTS